MNHYYVLMLTEVFELCEEEEGFSYHENITEDVHFALVARCIPSGKGFEMHVLIRSPLPKSELPCEVSDRMEEWVDEVRRDFHQRHLMSLP